MNERIFKLALEAMNFQGAIDTDTELKLSNDELEKFAELIVRECLNQLQQTAPPDITSEKLQGVVNSAHRYAIDVSGANIKQHFGVEE